LHPSIDGLNKAMDLETAIKAFGDFLARKQDQLGEPLAPTRAPPKRLSRGWAFYYQSRAYVETGDFRSQLLGQGPVVIEDDGAIIEGGSADGDPEALITDRGRLRFPG
jgi:hypothetical protein